MLILLYVITLKITRPKYLAHWLKICKQFVNNFIFFFQFILGEAAKKCKIWESAPHIKDIPAKNIAKFEKKVRGLDLVVYIELQLKFPALFEGLSYYPL